MQTISSTDSLILWKQNMNRTNIGESVFNGDKFVLKPFYANVFLSLAEKFQSSKHYSSFVDCWTSECDGACNLVKTMLFAHVNASIYKEQCISIVNKFRGNLGEIMVEMLVENGLLGFVKPGTYKPVDPNHEQYVDATAMKNGLPIGIQIKNYSKHNRVGREILDKAAAMSDLWLRRDKIIEDKDVLEFIKSPCQYVVSTVEPSTELLKEDFKSSVVFIGPKDLDLLHIQGNRKTGEKAMWKMFQEVYEEINSLGK